MTKEIIDMTDMHKVRELNEDGIKAFKNYHGKAQLPDPALMIDPKIGFKFNPTSNLALKFTVGKYSQFLYAHKDKLIHHLEGLYTFY